MATIYPTHVTKHKAYIHQPHIYIYICVHIYIYIIYIYVLVNALAVSHRFEVPLRPRFRGRATGPQLLTAAGSASARRRAAFPRLGSVEGWVFLLHPGKERPGPRPRCPFSGGFGRKIDGAEKNLVVSSSTRVIYLPKKDTYNPRLEWGQRYQS